MPSDPSTAGSARVAQLRRTISLRCSKSADNTRVPFERLDEPHGDYAIVAELLVRREDRRRGYARALLAHGERHAASQGAAELRIGVLSGNAAARALYLDYGFRPYIETLSKSPSHR